MKNILVVLLVILLCHIKVQSQVDGIVIEAEYKATGLCSSDSTKNNITYYIRKDILRVDIRGTMANSTIVFQPSTNKIWVLYHHEMLYYSMDKTEMNSLETVVINQSKEFQNSIANMDSTSRDQTLMIWPDGNPFMFEDPEYEVVNKKDSLISQLICDKYSGNLNNGNIQMLFVNNLKTTGIKDDELQILNNFSVFMGKGVKALSGNMDFANIYKKDVGGYPILIETFGGNMLCNMYWLKFIYRKKLDNKIFEIPLAYGKFENPLGNK